MNKQTGGPAFPVTSDNYANPDSTGMTLRDYFAAKAMQGIFNTAIEWFPTDQSQDEESLKLFKDIAQDSYAMADAMIKAREQ